MKPPFRRVKVMLEFTLHYPRDLQGTADSGFSGRVINDMVKGACSAAGVDAAEAIGARPYIERGARLTVTVKK